MEGRGNERGENWRIMACEVCRELGREGCSVHSPYRVDEYGVVWEVPSNPNPNQYPPFCNPWAPLVVTCNAVVDNSRSLSFLSFTTTGNFIPSYPIPPYPPFNPHPRPMPPRPRAQGRGRGRGRGRSRTSLNLQHQANSVPQDPHSIPPSS